MNLPNIHTRRVKGMHHLNGFLGTICSAGNVSLWSTSISDKKLTLICTITDESIRPTCIKLIDTTENRFKEQPDTKAEMTKENQPLATKMSRPISTTGKIIVEMEASEKKALSSTNENWKLQISDDDTDTEMAKASEKKPTKKKKLVSPKGVASTITPTVHSLEGTPKTSKKKVDGGSVTKAVVVRSVNSEDDFEKSDSKRSKKKKSITDASAVNAGQPATQMRQLRKSTSKKDPRNISIVNDTVIKKKSLSTSIQDGTPKHKSKSKTQAAPTEISQKTTKNKRKSDVNETGQPKMATRNMKRKLTNDQR